MKSLADIDVSGKRLLVRADLNVPVQNGQVTDATRIERFASGMRPLLERGARLVILTHFGRPKAGEDPALSTRQLQAALSKALGRVVGFVSACRGRDAEAAAARLVDGGVLLCENVRFEPGEEQNDEGLARDFARLGDIFVNDAFSCAHRAHASTEAVARLMPAFAGPLMEEELQALEAALAAPRRPAVAIVGGAKVSSKIAVLKNLVGKLDAVIIGGGMANTFLYAQGAPMGRSLHEADQLKTVYEIEALAARSGCRILLPDDVMVAAEFREGAPARSVPFDECPADMMILDAGPRSVRLFQEELSRARTILWNGPLGAFEIAPFDRATTALSRSAAALTDAEQVVSVAGGGDTVAALNRAEVTERFTYVSTAGGAFLEWLEGRVLPGVAALSAEPETV